MKITIFEAKQVEIETPAYYRRSKGENITNWYICVNADGRALVTATNGNHEGSANIQLDGNFTPCTAAEFFEALAANTAAVIKAQSDLAIKWGLETLELEGGAYAD